MLSHLSVLYFCRYRPCKALEHRVEWYKSQLWAQSWVIQKSMGCECEPASDCMMLVSQAVRGDDSKVRTRLWLFGARSSTSVHSVEYLFVRQSCTPTPHVRSCTHAATFTKCAGALGQWNCTSALPGTKPLTRRWKATTRKCGRVWSGSTRPSYTYDLYLYLYLSISIYIYIYIYIYMHMYR